MKLFFFHHYYGLPVPFFQKWAQKKAANLFRLTACVPLWWAMGI
ncbi:hypothetical protein [Blautia sp. An249]|nr:hypothetical protein [Blautia sp. An249]